MGRRVNLILIFILILGTLLRLKGVTNPYLDDQGWRQADTASMALNMLGHLGNFPEVFFPMLNYDGTGPQPVELEFPFLPYLLAWTWTMLGWSDLWGRVWAIFFSLVTIYGVYKFGKLAFSEEAGLWAAAFYAGIPLTIYYGRTTMPEPVAQAISIWALVTILAWRKNPAWKSLLLAAIIMAGAILAKLPQLMIFPVALILGFFPFRQLSKMFIYCALSLILPMVYYSWVHLGAGAASQFVSGIVSYQVFEGQNNFFNTLAINLKSGLGLSILLAGWGLILLIGKGKLRNELGLSLIAWVTISLAYLAIICLRIPLDYYLVPVVLPIAILTGYALSDGDKIPSFVVGVLAISLLLTSQYANYGSKYQWNEDILSQAQWLRENTTQESVLVLSDSPPMTLYYAQRYGFRLVKTDDNQAWADLEAMPGDYLIALSNSRGKEFWERVEGVFPLVGPGVYRLSPSQ